MNEEERIFVAFTACQKVIRKLAHPYRISILVALQNKKGLKEPEIKRGKRIIFRGCLGLGRSKEEAPIVLATCNAALETLSSNRAQVLDGLRTIFLLPPDFFTDNEMNEMYESGFRCD